MEIGQGDDGTVMRIEALVASAFAIPPEAIRAPGRGAARTAFARQVAIYLNHTRLGLNFTEAATRFGRDRTTVAHACRCIEDRREDPRFDAIVDVLERAIAAWDEPIHQRPAAR